ncbi:MAG TPA: hypothetical protein VK868_08625, partial [Pyrinomonadaceae bacterium]|nr:hypothetical protein [Pyrinomonadaceae bacterium]
MIKQITETPEYQKLLAELRANARVISISGLVAGSARALAVAALQRETGKTFAVVSHTTRDLESWERDLSFWYSALTAKETSDKDILVLPASETDPYAGISPHAQTLERRALALWRLQQRSAKFVLLTARALARKTVTPAAIAKSGITLRRDEDFSPEVLVDQLMATGYMREDPVGGVGEFSMRGGIVDVWPPGREAPVRLEFFGDTVDSLREFDPETQLSTGQLDTVEVPPMREWSV